MSCLGYCCLVPGGSPCLLRGAPCPSLPPRALGISELHPLLHLHLHLQPHLHCLHKCTLMTRRLAMHLILNVHMYLHLKLYLHLHCLLKFKCTLHCQKKCQGIFFFFSVLLIFSSFLFYSFETQWGLRRFVFPVRPSPVLSLELSYK